MFNLLRRQFLSKLLLVFLLTSLPASTSMPLFAAPHVPPCGFAEVIGRVTDSGTGAPIPSAIVQYAANDVANSDFTDTEGRYSVNLPVYLEPGPYALMASQLSYLTETHSEELVPISGTTTTVDFVLSPGATIACQVRALDTGLPITRTMVTAFPFPPDDLSIGGRSDMTDENGFYSISGLQEGAYGLEFSPRESYYEYGITYLGGEYTADASEVISVTPPLTMTADISLTRGLTITGFVTRTDTGERVSGVLVTPYTVDGQAIRERSFRTIGAGRFNLYGLSPGMYKLGFTIEPAFGIDQDEANFELLGEFYQDTSLVDEAMVIELTATDPDTKLPRTGIALPGVGLDPGATVHGTVKDIDDGTPIADALVYTSKLEGDYDLGFGDAGIRTDTSGAYTLTGVSSGLYQLSFSTPGGSHGPQVMDGVPVSTTITITEPQVEYKVETLLKKTGFFSGKITDSNGQPIPDVVIDIETADTKRHVTSVFSDDDGMYTSRPLINGDYVARFIRNEPCGCYNNEYFTGDNQGGQVASIMVNSDQTTAGIDIVLACGQAPPPRLPGVFLPFLR